MSDSNDSTRDGQCDAASTRLPQGFAIAYLVLAPSGGHSLLWNEALVVSLTAFHGRGFVAAEFQPGEPQAVIAAVEAVIGLLIEIIFIATFTQRFFEK
jgi:hypothetical protein